jgi:phosphoribosyl-ATP pyrophosphohydrolase
MEVLAKIFGIIQQRAAKPEEGSYTNYLLAKGLDKILKKIGEEASETIIAAKNTQHGGSPAGLTGEIADLLYHLLVLLHTAGLTPQDVEQELNNRFAKGGFHGRNQQ